MHRTPICLARCLRPLHQTTVTGVPALEVSETPSTSLRHAGGGLMVMRGLTGMHCRIEPGTEFATHGCEVTACCRPSLDARPLRRPQQGCPLHAPALLPAALGLSGQAGLPPAPSRRMRNPGIKAASHSHEAGRSAVAVYALLEVRERACVCCIASQPLHGGCTGTRCMSRC